MKLNKYDITAVVIVMVMIIALLCAMYITTIKTGMYITCDNGVETHHYLKVDVFGNRWETGTRSWILHSR